MKNLLLITLSLIAVCGASAKKGNTELKIMSYNIRHGLVEKSDTGLKHWDNRKFATINMINTEKPDIIGFQEMKEVQQLYAVENLPEYDEVFHSRGNTKYTMYRKDRFTKLDQGCFWLSETPEKSSLGWGSVSIRPTLWVKLKDKKTGKILYFFNTHLDVRSFEARIKGAALNVDYMKKICGKKAIQFIVGDMNTQEEDDLKVYETWLKNGRKEAPATDDKPTYNGFGKTKNPTRLDHIYYRNATAVRYQVLDGKNYGVEYISDHYPVMLTVKY